MIRAFLKKQEKSQTNNLNYHFKELEKEQIKPKVSRRKKIIKIIEKINKIETVGLMADSGRAHAKEYFLEPPLPVSLSPR